MRAVYHCRHATVKNMPKLRTAAIALALLIAVGLLWFREQTPRRRVDPPAILTQVQQLNQLATVRYTVQKVVGLTEQKQPVGSEAILLILQASVEAGIDLAALRQGDIAVRPDGTVTLRLPPAKILNVTIDEGETKVWDRSKTWWTPWVPYSLDLEQRARRTGLESIQRAAVEMGILKQAERNAETSIRALLGLAGIESVLVIPAGSS
jgi:hypothetical protein